MKSVNADASLLRLSFASGEQEKVGFASASGDPEDAETERVRWWITWPGEKALPLLASKTGA